MSWLACSFMMPSVPSIPLTAASLAQTCARASLNGKREDSNPVVISRRGSKLGACVRRSSNQVARVIKEIKARSEGTTCEKVLNEMETQIMMRDLKRIFTSRHESEEMLINKRKQEIPKQDLGVRK